MNIIKTLFVTTAFLGGGYLVFRNTPFGRETLRTWILKRWQRLSKVREKEFDRELLAKELEKLEYQDLELLYRYTLIDPMGKPEQLAVAESRVFHRATDLLSKMSQVGTFKKADLSSLENFILPG